MEEVGTHMAEITEFVPLEAVDPVYFDKAYYLAPDKGGAKPYALLASALRESKRCALGRWAARGKQYIVMIRPVEDGLVMQQLLYAGEVRAMKDLEIPKTEVKPAELKLAQQLIEQQASETFDPSAVHRRGGRAHRGRRAEEGRGPGDHAGRGARRRRRAGHRSHGSAAREPREEGAGAREGRRARPRPQRASRPSARSRPKPPAPAARKAAKKAKPARARATGSGGAPVRRPRRREAAAPVAQHDPLADRGRLRHAHARAPRRVAVLLPGPDRAAHRAGAGRRQRARSGGSRARCASCAATCPRRCRCPDCRIGAVADRVVVREGGSRWQAESGQYLLEFDGDPADGSLSVIEREAAEPPQAERARVVRPRARRWRRTDVDAALAAYERAIAADPAFLDAHINLGRLLHERGALRERRARLSRGDQGAAATIRCCSTTSACCSTTMDRADGRDRCAYEAALAAIPASPIATTTWRCCTRSSRSRRKRCGTWRGIARSLGPRSPVSSAARRRRALGSAALDEPAGHPLVRRAAVVR